MTAPSRPAANSDSRNEGWFGPSHATRSPLATPSVRRPLASRRPRSATSEYVSERFPAIRATALGAALARRSIHEPTPALPKAVCAVIANPLCRQPSRRGSRSAGPADVLAFRLGRAPPRCYRPGTRSSPEPPTMGVLGAGLLPAPERLIRSGRSELEQTVTSASPWPTVRAVTQVKQ